MINVLIADDHQLLIDGIKTTLEDVPEIQVIAEAKDGFQVLETLETQDDIDVIIYHRWLYEGDERAFYDSVYAQYFPGFTESDSIWVLDIGCME